MNEEVKIRLSEYSDAKSILEWFKEPGILRWYPLANQWEIEDGVRISMSFIDKEAAITAVVDDQPVGFAHLYLHPFKKLAHQCLFFIIVSEKYRNRGIGTLLVKHLEKMAKEQFCIEILHLEVYEHNPAIALYERLGYQKYGFQEHFLKESDGSYRGKIFMQKIL